METGLSRTESQAAIEGQNWRLSAISITTV